jgi:hypothetical protein
MRVTFWDAHGSAGLIVENGTRRLCCLRHHPANDEDADSALIEAIRDADLLVFPGDWEHGLRLKERAGVKLLALAPPVDDADLGRLAHAAAQKSPNVFFARRKMRVDL